MSLSSNSLPSLAEDAKGSNTGKGGGGTGGGGETGGGDETGGEVGRGSSQKWWKRTRFVVKRNTVIAVGVAVAILLVVVPLIVFFTTRDNDSKDRSPTTTTKGPSSSTSVPPTESPLTIRISPALVPRHYHVRLQPFIRGNFSVLGSVAIQVEVVEPTARIVLHMADIVTKNGTIKVTRDSLAGTEVVVTKHEYDRDLEYYVGHLEDNLVQGRTYFISMEFTGYLNDQLKGFYRSVYKNEEGEDVYIATTQFQPTDARRAFPCFDEPALKANFSIAIVREESMTAVSNMPLVSSSPVEGQEGWVLDQFAESVPMSTYLVAFVVSDFVHLDVHTTGGTLFRVFARKEVIELARYSLQLGAEVLTFFENYFNIPYPLPKQDMFAIPDFSAGAMENWGLITYRESLLLYDPSISTVSNKERIGEVVVHELAHQWFGNLVTPSWWTDLWLNEGFATYMSYVGLDPSEPTWSILDQFMPLDLHYVLGIDALPSSHPVSVVVNSPDEISSIFDAISYSKGASIIRMMKHFLGEDTFKKGLTEYLNERAYDAAEQDQLWSALTEQAHDDGTLDDDVTVKEIMDSWTLQMGYPVVTVSRTGTQATVKQERFLLTEVSDRSVEADYMWWVPLTFITESSSDQKDTFPSHWLPKTQQETVIDGLPTPAEWVLFNTQQTGYYRVNYDQSNWDALIAQLHENHTKINPVNRAQIMDDSLNLARAGILPYETSLRATVYLSNETEFVPWASALSALGYLESMFTRQEDYIIMKRHLSELIIPLYERVGFEDDVLQDPHLTQKLRVTAASWACHLGHQPCSESAIAVFREWRESDGNATVVSPNLKSTVYCSGVAAGNSSDWAFTWRVAQTTNLASERDLLLTALGCSEDEETLKEYLVMTFSPNSPVRLQDTRTVFRAVARRDAGRDVAWDYLEENLPQMLDYTSSFSAVGDYVETAAFEFNTREELEKLLALQAQHSAILGSGTAAVSRAVQRTRANIEWVNAHYEPIVGWLEEQYETTQSNTTLTPTEPPLNIRLPPALVPRHYNIKLQPFIGGNFSVLGSVAIQVEVVEPTARIVLHMADIVTKNDTIKVTQDSLAGTEVGVTKHEYDRDLEYYIGHLEENLEQGRTYFISMEFTGYLNDQLKGFYRSVYKNEKGEDVYIATTQFQPTDARRAFPCFDEPALKANFSIAIVREESMTAVSNMPLVSSTPVVGQEGWVLDQFEESVPMSTYLVAFVVSDFVHLDVHTTGGTLFRVFARKEVIELARYSLQLGAEVLTFFENYFNIPYPLPKQDMFAIPDFSAGAMENWGLITYRESLLLYDPSISTVSNKERIGEVVVHELAHQWFGNLVTPSWWTDLWLNEGFATYMSYVGLDPSEPTWSILDQFMPLDLHYVLGIDALPSSHPVSVVVNSPDEISSIFDAISYSKGASIIRMMKHFLKEDTFKQGLTEYLKDRAYDAAEQDQLWSALTAQAHEDGTLDDDVSVKEIMDSWTLQMGYPVVTVNRTGTQAAVKQERFLLTEVSDCSDEADYMWWVPLTFITESSIEQKDTFPSHWLSKTQQETVIDGLPTPTEWVLFNTQQTGYYRVNYDQGNWDALIAQLQEDHTKINPVNRAQIMDDSLNLARAGIVPYETSLRATVYLSNETEYVPWASALSALGYLESMFTRQEDYIIMKRHLSELIVPLYDLVGFEDDVIQDPHLTQKLRVTAASWACHLAHQPCMESAIAVFKEWRESDGNATVVSPNLKSTVYCAGVAAGNSSDWDFTWGVAQTTNLASERDLLLTALGCSENEETLKQYLALTFSPNSPVRLQDTRTVFRAVARRDAGRDVAWDYLEENLPQMLDYTSSFSAVGDYVETAAFEFNTQEELGKLLALQAQHSAILGSGTAAVSRAVQRTRANIEWVNAHYEPIVGWLEEQYETTPPLNIRLPPALVPRHYNVKLHPLIGGNFSVLGSVAIQVEVVEPTARIVLHMADIVTKNETIKVTRDSLAGTEVGVTKHEYDRDLEYYIGHLEDNLEKGQTYFISMEFTGYLNDQLKGFYRSVYKNKEGEDVYIATTQFQATDARRAFPCFDEPALKANFSIAIVREENMTAVSNMPLVASTPVVGLEGWVLDQFEESVPMSTYLVAFVVSDFVHMDVTTTGGTLFRVFARKEVIELAQYSLQLGAEVLTFFENYFNIPYPLPKQDMFAIPDFSAGAMENWGLITYRESLLLYDPSISTVSNKERIGEVVVHELAHQWFGNLVTPSWWTDLWLNEGFATYMSYVGLDPSEPTWSILDQFMPLDLHYVLGIDALPSSHPVSVVVNSPNEISSIFDAISYSKGASIIRMMKHFLKEDTFKQGLTEYLNDRAYDAAEQDQLWSALTAQAHEDGTLDVNITVKTIMDTWTLQMGYPVVTVSRTGTQATVKQERFLLTGVTDPTDEADYMWWVPLTFITESSIEQKDTFPSHWLSRTQQETVIDGLPTPAEWVLFNTQQTGYYRVNYDQGNWDALITQLQEDHTKINPVNRAQIMDDSLNLARAGIVPYETSLRATVYLSKETEFVPWASALSGLGYLESMFTRQEDYIIMKRHLSELIIPLYERVGFEDDVLQDPHLTQKLRVTAASWACHLGHQPCRESAIAVFREWRESDGNATVVSPNLKSTVYCAGVAAGNSSDWDFTWRVAQTTNLASERDLLLTALGCSEDEETLKEYLALTFSPNSSVRLQDTRTVFRAVARRDAGRDVAWDYLEENLPQMLDYTSSFSAVGDYVETAAFEFNTQEELDKLLALQAQHSPILGSGTAAVSRAVQRTRANIEWVTAHYEPIVDWLEKQYPTPFLNIRLPQSIIPHHYLIRLRPFIGGNFSIEGLVSIEMTVAEATSQVVLHMADIVTKNETVKVTRGSEAGSEVPILLQEYDPQYQYYVATLGEELVRGETYFISMEFTGFLNDQLRGFYRSVYQNEQGVDVYLAMTMMAPTDARRAFPCFDEPELKANFTIVLGREEGMTALSNMPLNNSVQMPGNPGWVWDEFQTSVRMSTYLVAFAISDFSYNHVDNVGASNITFGVTARAAAMSQTEYALEVGPAVLAFYEQYFEIPYPLPKQDMLAAPDFAAGAMENWGLITYRETAIIYDPELSTASSKQRVGAVIAHELAHQWFGNLVTPSWWTDIWLNEGFASYMENIGLQSHEADWGLIEQFVISDLQSVFVIDSLLTSHQISIAVNTTAEINSLFDSISYSKGASLLRMISHFLTEETFRHGLINYLNDKAYQAAAQDDLWEALTAQAEADGNLPTGVTVKDIMDPWTLQMGYPYITVARVEGGKATVTQKRFLSDGSDGPSDEPHYMWWIPLSFTGQNNPDFSQTRPAVWLNDTETEKTLENLPQNLNEWVVFNLQETGYYRVNYDKANWNALSQQLVSNHSIIHLVNRAQLLDDSLNLARAGILDYDTALSLTAYLATETEFVPWTAGLNGLSYLESMFTRTDGYGELKAYLLDLVVPVFDLVGFTDSLEDPHLTQLLRVTAASWACHLGYQPCLDSALTAFQGWTASDGLATSVSPNLKSTTYCTGVAEGNETVWNFVWAQYQKSGLASEKDLLLQALGCSQETWILEKYLEMAFTEGSGIRKQDLGTVFQSVASNDLGRDLAWEYLSTNWDDIVAYADTFTILSRLIDSATAEFSSQEELDKLVQFQSDNAASLGAAERSVEQAVERTTTNIVWLDNNYQDILDWVNGTSQSSTEEPSSSTSLPSTEPPLTIRLPSALVPRHYRVQLQPFIGGNFSVLGSVAIQVEVVEPTARIVLHMADIVTKNDTIKVTRTSQNGVEIPFSNPEYDPDLEYFILPLGETLEEGQTIFLLMDFVGYLNDQLRGFYRSVYENDSGEDVYIATTQFQPTDARRAFPCFDEPALKANFSIAIVREESMTAVSNMPLVSSSPVNDQPGWVLDTFAESVPMSTYLVAFVVSDFTYVNTTTTYGTEFRVYAREGGIANADYALETGSEILTFFEGYFNISYPLPKQDMFAVPDFAFGAMENWGLIVYRESALLYSPQTSTASNHQRVGVIVAHELAHQWFGNLVTPSWWTDLWLNEGFASYMEYIGLHAMMEQFVSIDLHDVFGVDALGSSHPISITVEHPDQINEIFDAISYSKGASIIRMMSHFLSESTFNAGITNYLRQRAYDAAEQDQLWIALTTQAHEDGTLDDDVTVKDIMDTWTLQMGYPVVTVIRTGTQATVKQERFLLTGVAAPTDEADYMWWVPLTFITESSSDQLDTFPSHWLSKTQQETVIEGLPTPAEWVLFNTQQTGYYRVNYDQGNWDALIAQLQEDHTKINVINRAQILDDSLNLARAGLVSYATALSANAYLVHETEYVPWRSALRNFEFLESMFSREKDFAIMKKYLLELIVPLYESLGFEDHLTDPHPNQLLRVYVITWACRLGHGPCLDQAQATYREWVESGGNDTSVAPNLKSTVYCAGVAAGDSSDWDFTWRVAQTTNLASERDLLLTALGCSKDEETLKEYLTRAFTEGSGLRKQDTGRVFSSVASNDVGRDVAWDFLEERFLAMSEYSGSFTATGGYVKSASAEFNTQADLDKLLMFKATYNGSLGSAERAVDQAIEGVTANIAWMTNHYKDIASWLLDRYPSSNLTIRLPSTLVPRHYSLRLLPLLEEGNFSTLGSVQIEVEVVEATSLVVLHMAQIITKNDTIKISKGSPSGTAVSILRHEYLPDLEFYVANLAEKLTAGETYFISMEFVGHLNDNLLGFYRSVYKDDEGQDVFLAATKFQPTYARRAFPCFDEPALKANFSITIGRPETMTTISNMPRMVEATVSIDDHPGWVWDQFEESVPMPTYLVAFVVSDFNFTANTTAGDTLFRVWARESAIEQADYSLDIGVRGLDFFENYFNIPYPLPKQDMIALPDFSSGAMENWGLITYREVYMLHDPVQSMASQKQLVGVVVIHELAHQWFGNLVTPSWWNDIWLNEGFASYMEYVGIEALEPSWKIGEQFVSTDLHSVFALDCLMSSHPISVQVDHPNQIRELFDSISYGKGASIIRMMEHFLTTETFRKGLTIFLNNNAYDAAEQDQLWSALTTQAHEDGTLDDDVTVKEIMDTWTLQMGYPVVTVSRTGTQATVKQERFVLGNASLSAEEDYTWWVPLSYTTQSGADFDNTSTSRWLTANDTGLVIADVATEDDDWVLFNIHQTGYYRVNYDDDNWRALSNQLHLNHSVIGPINRAQLVDDALNLAQSGELNYSIALDLTRYLAKEEAYVTWSSALRNFKYLESMASWTTCYQPMRSYLLSLLDPLFKLVGFEDSVSHDHLTQLLRVTATSWSCDLQLEACVENATQLFQKWMDEDGASSVVSPNLKSTVFCTGILHGESQEWNFVWEQFQKSNLAADQDIFLYALGCSGDEEILQDYLNKTFFEGEQSLVRKQDSWKVFRGVARNDKGRDLAWDFLTENWDFLKEYFGSHSSLERFLTDVTYEFNTQEKLNELLVFRTSVSSDFGTATQTVDQAVERTRGNIAWMDLHFSTVRDWLLTQSNVECLPDLD